MTNKEFSDEFSVLVNSFDTAPNIVLDEYEKSIFLTTAQEQVVLELYNGLNNLGKSFEKTEELRRHLDSLVLTVNPVEDTGDRGDFLPLTKQSILYQKPENLWFITYESVSLQDEILGCKDRKEALIVPTTQDELFKTMNNPFKKPSDKRVLRLDRGDEVIELVTKYKLGVYTLRYLKKPSPIVLIDLLDLSINGIKEETSCELNPMLHRAILERAVKLALISKTQLSGHE